MPSTLKLTNNAVARLAGSIVAGSTSISLAPGNGALFPAITGAEHFPATLVAVDGTFEIIDVTARVGDVLTVTRAQEGTAAAAFTAGDRLELRLTAGALSTELERLQTAIDAAVTSLTVIAALGYTPYNATNPSDFQSLTQMTAAIAAAVAPYLPKAGGTMTGALKLPDGTQAAPSLSWTGAGDSDTGFFHISDGIIGIVCNNVLVGRFTATGFEAIKITQTA